MALIHLRVRSFTPGLDKPSVSVDETCTEAVESLLTALYPDNVSLGPGPKLFFKGLVLNEAYSPIEAGVKTGCTLVAVPRRSLPPSQPANLGPVPDKATIDTLTIGEARSRGLPEEAQQAAVPKASRMQTVEAQLMGMLQGDPSFQAGLFGGNFHLGGEGEEEEEDEEEGAEPADVEVPEPDAQGLVNLQEMGFSAGAARRALLLNRNRPADAVDWVLNHSSDSNLEVPLTPEELQQAWRPQRRRRRNPSAPDPDHIQQMLDMGFDRERSSSVLMRVHNNLEHACQLLLAENTLREASGAGNGNDTTSGGAEGAAGAGAGRGEAAAPGTEPAVGAARAEQGDGEQPQGDQATMESSASSSSEYTTDDEAGDAHMMGASSSDEEGGDHVMGFMEGLPQDSDSDLDEYDMDDDDDSNSDMDEVGDDMHMAGAEDDYEVGLQDLPQNGSDGAPHSISVGLSFGPDGEPFHAMVGLQDLISNHNDEQIIQEIQSSPVMIDAVQSLLAGGGAPLAHLSDHPEMATLVRRLRRIVGIETDGDEATDLDTLPPAAPSNGTPNPGNLQMLSQALVALATHASAAPSSGPVPGPAAAAILNSGFAGGGGAAEHLLRRLSSASRPRDLRADLSEAVGAPPPPAATQPATSQPGRASQASGERSDGTPPPAPSSS